MPNQLLIIEMDARLAETLREHFTLEQYQVHVALTCREGLQLAQTVRPSLILLAARMGDMAGIDAFRALRDTPRTGHIPVMIMAGQHEIVLQNKILEEGVYDFIEKPLDLDILTLRVRNALRRAERDGLTEPRTGLPTGRLIEEQTRSLANRLGWFRIDTRIDNFNIFRDLYGFVTANEVLRFAGNSITQLVNEHGTQDDFVGHRNGSEEFIIITTLGSGLRLVEALSSRLNLELQSFYNFMERDQGYVLIQDGSGKEIQKPLMLAHITVTQGEPDPNASAAAPTPPRDPWVDAEDNQDKKPDSPPSGSAFEW
jgi:DNA-binding response OmpR family regulator